ncbi:MAG: FAD-dependent oxidoreductase, partial [Dehalococcoidia bacterium]|nr:FAD-dependent oxidoreductase [Dehalococcoidia bacterium]
MTTTVVRPVAGFLTIDGRKVVASEGQTVLDAALKAGVYVPNLCSYPGLKPLAEEEPDRACQLCIVEVGGKVVRACSTPASDGLVVETNTPRLQELRRTIVTGILRRHPNACLTCHRTERCGPFDICLRDGSVEERCVTCPKNKNCALQRVVDYVGVGPLPGMYQAKKLPVREDSPFWVRDNNLCILCKRCVRVCRDVRGAAVIDFAYPCHTACPAGIDIPRYIRLVGRGRPAAALAVIREKVPFPGALGRVCVHPCEQACQRGLVVDKPLNIRLLKRYAADHGDESWKEKSRKLPSTGKKVAVVGAGPAGLTAGYYLAKQGHKVTVFEALPAAGGMMRVGIPEYRLPRDVLTGEIKEIESAGVEILLNSRIESIDALFEKGYDAVFLGMGSHEGVALGVAGDTSSGVIDAADFLRRANLGEKVKVGEVVGVVGGGNVAIDAARTSLRLGAKKVTVFYRRTRSEMPANAEEVEGALEEGVEFVYLAAPHKISTGNGKLVLECLRMELGAPDESDRRTPVPVKGSEFVNEMDTLVAAVGQRTGR